MTRLRLTIDGIQSWIGGSFNELQLVRGGSMALTDIFERVIPSALDDALSEWRPIKIVSGHLDIEVEDSEEATASRTLITVLSERDGLPFSLHRLDDEAWRPIPTPPRPTFAPGTEPCRYSAAAPATGEHRGRPASADVLDRARRRPDSDEMLEWDLGKIGTVTRSARFAGYVGVIVADGDDIGHRVAEAAKSGPEALFKENRRLTEEASFLVDVARQAGVAVIGDDFRWNPVITGGDDITLVVPADAAPDMAVALAGQPKMSDGGSAMAVSVGIAVVAASFPFHLARDRAEHLLREAKAERRRLGRNTPFIGLAFELGPTPGVRWHDGDLALSREQFNALVECARTTRAPSSGLRRLQSAVVVGGRVADREWAIEADSVLMELDPSLRPSIGDLIDLRSLLAAESGRPGGREEQHG